MSWNENAIFYHIYPLGTFGAEDHNNYGENCNNRILQLNSWIPYLKELGINAIYLGPLFESTSHGYDTKDFFWVDKRLGSNEDLKNVIRNCHENGIRVVLDGVFNHTGREFWAFKDIQQNRQGSQYAGWYSNLNFNNNNGYNDGFSYDGWNGHYNLVKLNLKNPAVTEHLFDAVRMWIDYFDIDGIRLDAADCLDLDFLKNLKNVCYSKKGDFYLMAEIIHGDYNKWMNGSMCNSVTNYECYKGLWSAHNDKNYFEIAYAFNRQSGNGGLYKNLLYNFVDNHDVNRVASILKKEESLYLTYALLFTMCGNPSLYYGSEVGIKGEKTNSSDKPLRPYIDIENLKNISKTNPLFAYIKRLINIRSNSNALKIGSYKQLHLSLEQFAFLREYNNEKVVVALNQSNKDISININVDGGRVIDILNNNEEFHIDNGKLSLPLYPSCTRILVVQ